MHWSKFEDAIRKMKLYWKIQSGKQNCIGRCNQESIIVLIKTFTFSFREIRLDKYEHELVGGKVVNLKELEDKAFNKKNLSFFCPRN